METYKINYGERLKCINTRAKQNKKPIAKFLRFLEWLIIIATVLFCVWSIYSMIYIELGNYYFESTVVMLGYLFYPFIAYTIVHAFYKKCTGSIYNRAEEKIILTDKGFRYYYCLSTLPSASCTYDVEFEKITSYSYDEETKWLDIIVDCEFNTYDNGILDAKTACISKGLDFFDTYDGICVHELLKEKVKLEVNTKNINE